MSEQTVELGFKPYPHQRAAHALRLVTRFLVLVWHRRAGKTLFCIFELGLAALACTKPFGRFGYVCPELAQAKKVSWSYLRAFGRQIPGSRILEGELSVILPNGARIQLFGADNPHAFRGQYFDGLILDEVAQMKPTLWGEVLRPCLMDRQGWAIFIGTPNGTNLFSDLYYQAIKGKDGWGADLKRWSDTRVIPDAEIEQARNEMTEAQFAQEMDCDFAAAVVDALIKLDLVLAAQRRKLSEEQYYYAPKVMGIDPARYGDDRTAIVVRQGPLLYPADIYTKQSTTQVSSHAARIIDKVKPDAIFIDMGGLGAGIVDQLIDMNYSPVGVYFNEAPVEPRFKDKRAEMWWDMSEWLKDAAIPDDATLATDLTGPRFTYKDSKGKFRLESKDDMRKRGVKSPDLGDSCALTFYAPVAPKHRGARERVAKTQYDWRTGKAK